MISRRSFLKTSTLAAGALALAGTEGCVGHRTMTGGMVGPNAARGHKIREKLSGKPSQLLKQDFVVIGGGVSGLSAARWLHRHQVNALVLELEDESGGNSRAGQNSISSYPWGAHYLPIPSPRHRELLEFLEECGVITGYENNLPVYNEYHLCFDPKERLYINQHWQEGLIPNEGLPAKDREEIQTFLKVMDEFRHKKGRDGKPAFDIPLDRSSQDPELLKWDQLSFRQFLLDRKLTSVPLHWYVDYCCADDYGGNADQVSAWAGIHYFAARRGEAANAKIDDVLTWPEGNYFLVKHLRQEIQSFIRSKCVVLSIREEKNTILIDYWDDQQQQLVRIEASKIILATPQYVNKHILASDRKLNFNAFQYTPWMVANLTTTSTLDEKRGEPLSWDNVIYGSQSLGYVHATHQHINLPANAETVITYYRPLLQGDAAAARKAAHQTSWNDWTSSIFNDLRGAHPELAKITRHCDVWTWGHGMILPRPGLIWGNDRRQANKSIGDKIFFAHSDLSGVSIFEEAFERGVLAATALIKSL